MSRSVAARPLLVRYGFALVMVGAALGATKVIGEDNIGIAPLFFAAVMISAWFGGLGPGLLATALAAASSAYFFFFPHYSFWIHTDDIIRGVIFVAVAVLISSLQAQAQEAREQAEAANRAKDRFLAILSHELRNPLNPVLTAAEMLQRDATLPAGVREDARMIRRNIELEARLIDDLLEVSRAAQGKLQLHREPLDAHAAVHDALRVCEAEARAKKVGVLTRLEAHPSFVHADPARLRQMFWNLFKNAVKFTPPGGAVTVATAVEPGMGDNGTASRGQFVLRVTDTGIGIEPDALPRIFNAFDQGGEEIGRRFGGLGLGLAIVQKLVAAHGGTLEAASDGRDRGATFTVRLASEPAPVPPPAAEAEPFTELPHWSAAQAELAPRRMRILLVEDQEDTARIMTRLLRHMDHDVLAAADVASALAAASDAQGQFDLVISDLGLPDGSGLDLMRELRQQYGLRGIALSGYGMEEDLQRSRDAGFPRPPDQARQHQPPRGCDSPCRAGAGVIAIRCCAGS
ncbi:MAG TPA: ATP-binding protein [Tepidisphaeraceae bacterium]|nr:ATP-binding protein [Tepidisphaeraceae bacterium]